MTQSRACVQKWFYLYVSFSAIEAKQLRVCEIILLSCRGTPGFTSAALIYLLCGGSAGLWFNLWPPSCGDPYWVSTYTLWAHTHLPRETIRTSTLRLLLQLDAINFRATPAAVFGLLHLTQLATTTTLLILRGSARGKANEENRDKQNTSRIVKLHWSNTFL